MFSSLHASAEFISPARNENVDYSFYMVRAQKTDKDNFQKLTALNTASLYKEANLPKVTSWASVTVMNDRFQKTRDLRFMKANSSGDFPRRISWLYPDDGCFARAALFNRIIFQAFAPVPIKVFVFGNLRVATSYSPRGRVGWWYHTAPVVEVQGEKYVLDPSIDISKPLRLKEWMARMGQPEKMKIAFCESGTYSPSDDCEKESDGLELRALRSQQKYLNLEWTRVKNLRLNPEIVLGENPTSRK